VTVRVRDQVIELAGDCPNEDAETLLMHLLADPLARVDWSACERAHTAVLQVLLAAQRPIDGSPQGTFLSQWIEPLVGKQ
jgi:hypothetical protein